MRLSILLRSKLLKSKRTASFYWLIISAAIIAVLLLLDAGFDRMSSQNREDRFNAMCGEGFKRKRLVIFPMFVVVGLDDITAKRLQN